MKSTLGPANGTLVTNEASIIRTYFDDIWDLICGEFDLDRPFRTAEVGALVAAKYGFATRTANDYARVIMHQVLRTTDQRDPALVRLTRHVWILPGAKPQ